MSRQTQRTFEVVFFCGLFLFCKVIFGDPLKTPFKTSIKLTFPLLFLPCKVIFLPCKVKGQKLTSTDSLEISTFFDNFCAGQTKSKGVKNSFQQLSRGTDFPAPFGWLWSLEVQSVRRGASDPSNEEESGAAMRFLSHSLSVSCTTQGWECNDSRLSQALSFELSFVYAVRFANCTQRSSFKARSGFLRKCLC